MSLTPIRQLVYASRAVNETSLDDLSDILEVSRKKNAEKNITGFLLFGQGIFTQVLEGSKGDIDALMEAISQDDRHCDVEYLVDHYVDQRTFAGWSMGFASLSQQELASFLDEHGIEEHSELMERLRTDGSWISSFLSGMQSLLRAGS